jgi:hypothetical protein
VGRQCSRGRGHIAEQSEEFQPSVKSNGDGLTVTVCELLVLHATENKMQIAVAGYDTVTPIRRLCNTYKLWHFASRFFICLITFLIFFILLLTHKNEQTWNASEKAT